VDKNNLNQTMPSLLFLFSYKTLNVITTNLRKTLSEASIWYVRNINFIFFDEKIGK